MKRLSPIFLILLIIALYYDVHFYRMVKVERENKHRRDDKIVSDFNKTKAARPRILNLLPMDSSDIVFVGNSLTESFLVTEFFNDIHVKNRGVSGYTAQDIVDNYQSLIHDHPKKIFLEIGINDIKYGIGDKEKLHHDLLNNFTTILKRIHTENPNTMVYVQSILPINKVYDAYQTDTINNMVRMINTDIQGLAKQYNYPYIDLYHTFASGDSLPEKYTIDGVHLNENGYALWVQSIKQYVN